MRWPDATRCAAACLALAAASACAHDSWYARDAAGGDLTIVTGTRYPKVDLVVPPESIADSRCTSAGASRSCWAEFRDFDITLDDKLVDVYLREVNPPADIAARWRALRAHGVAWQERYRKFTRIEIAPPGESAQRLAALRRPSGAGLEIVAAPDSPLRAGAVARFDVMSHGRPVEGLAVELVSERSPLGIWRRSDERGEVRLPLPFGGAWLVRAVSIEADGAERWRSRFATFAFDAH